jgi:hypothetical protein
VTLTDAIDWLAQEFSANRDECLLAIGPMRLDALLTHGYAHEQRGRYAVTEMGRKKLAMERPL